MDRGFKSITFFVLLLLLCVSEARPLLNPLPEEEVMGFSRTLKSSGPSPGGGHRVKKVQTFGETKDSGPSPGQGHRVQNVQTFGEMKDSGPSHGGGHWLNGGQDIGVVKHSGPSPGQGHRVISGNHS